MSNATIVEQKGSKQPARPWSCGFKHWVCSPLLSVVAVFLNVSSIHDSLIVDIRLKKMLDSLLQ